MCVCVREKRDTEKGGARMGFSSNLYCTEFAPLEFIERMKINKKKLPKHDN